MCLDDDCIKGNSSWLAVEGGGLMVSCWGCDLGGFVFLPCSSSPALFPDCLFSTRPLSQAASALEPVDHGAKINFFSFRLWVLGILSQ